LRRSELELLELGDGSDDEVRANLREMAVYNRLLGGLIPLRRYVWPAVEAAAREGRTARVLEAGCGSAALSAWLAARARRAGVGLHVYGLDLARRNLVIRQPEVRLLSADMTASPFGDGVFDAAFSTLTLHHLEPSTVVRAARELVRLTRGPVVFNDLVRGHVPELLFHLTKPWLARCRLTRHDALLSIQRAYTVEELRAILAEEGLPEADVRGHWPWYRMTAVIRA
jgi:SAM-dependent methyltransferase